MKYDAHLVTESSSDYELLDSGGSQKLERFGVAILARPETQALWPKERPELWKDAHAEFAFAEGKGAWQVRNALPDPWEVSFGAVRVEARLSAFKHTGIFPEQSPNWNWTRAQVENMTEPKVLNLFGYTGVASIVAALAGAQVTHVDASKQTLDWAHGNARKSRVPDDRIRWIPDDALAFVKRELRRGAKYDGIILDPPAFGRGSKGEVWHIEEDLPTLLGILKDLLSDAPGSFFLLNGYAAGYAPRSLAQAVEGVFKDVNGESGELHLKEASSSRVIPSGIYVRFTR